MAYVLRVELPDRPGALGAVATALGSIGADILAMDVLERGPGTAIDDLVVELPSGSRPDELITACESIPGVRVESVRPDPGVAGSYREWELIEAVTENPARATALLAELLPEVIRCDWAAVVEVSSDGADGVRTLATGGGAPSFDGVTPGWVPVTAPTALDPHATWVPQIWRDLDTELAAAPLGSSTVTLIVGRPGGPAIRPSEIARLGHLALLVAMVKGTVSID